MAEHKYDKIDDCCMCGAQVVYFEDVPVPGEGCDVVGEPWRGNPTPDQIADASGWLEDVFEDVPVVLDALQIVTAINRHYEGGWWQFVKDGGYPFPAA